MEIVLVIAVVGIVLYLLVKLLPILIPLIAVFMLVGFIMRKIQSYKQNHDKNKEIIYDSNHYTGSFFTESHEAESFNQNEEILVSHVKSVNDDNFFYEKHEIKDATIVSED